MELKPGSYSQLTALLMENKELWGAGFAKDDYLKFNLQLSKHPWSKQHLRRLVLVDKVNRVRSSVKVHEQTVIADKTPLRAAQLSALFTPESQRGRGFAAALMQKLEPQLRERGFDLALLFADQTGEFFGRFGFSEIEKFDLAFDLVIPAEPRRKVEASRHKIPEPVKKLYRQNRPPHFAIERKADYWDFLRYRKTLFNRLQWDQGRESLHLCEDGAAYLWTLWSGQQLFIKDAAYKNPEALADLFSHLLQRHGNAILRQAAGWLPRSFEELPFVKNITYQKRERPIFMARDLTGKNKKLLAAKPYDLQFFALDCLHPY